MYIYIYIYIHTHTFCNIYIYEVQFRINFDRMTKEKTIWKIRLTCFARGLTSLECK